MSRLIGFGRHVRFHNLFRRIRLVLLNSLLRLNSLIGRDRLVRLASGRSRRQLVSLRLPVEFGLLLRIRTLQRRIELVQLLQRREAEMLQKDRRRSVEERMPRQFRLADKAYELHVHQRLDVRRDVDTANLLDFAFCERLTVGDDRERFERRTAKTAWAVHLQHGAHIPSAARHRLQPIGSVDTNELEADARDL